MFDQENVRELEDEIVNEMTPTITDEDPRTSKPSDDVLENEDSSVLCIVCSDSLGLCPFCQVFCSYDDPSILA